MHRLIWFSILLLGSQFLAAQKWDYNWVVGSSFAGLVTGASVINFEQSPPDTTLFTFQDEFSFTGIAWVSDVEGELQAYSNGCVVNNREHRTMLNGAGLNPGAVYNHWCPKYGYPYDGILMLPHPGSTKRYGLFSITHGNSTITPSDLLYNEIDIDGDGGLGEVVLKNQLVIVDSLADQISACRHANGRDWWVVTPRTNSNRFYLTLYDSVGLQTPSEISTGPAWNTLYYNGQFLFSPDGTLFARANPFNGTDIYTFDRCSGTLNHALHLPFPSDTVIACGLAFSPDSRFLYYSLLWNVWQIDLHAADPMASLTKVAEYDGFVSLFATRFYEMLLSPEGKIYIGCTNGVNVFHVIHKPDEKGEDCMLEQHGFYIPSYYLGRMPNMPNYRLFDAEGTVCDSLDINGYTAAWSPPVNGLLPLVSVFPNPAASGETLHFVDNRGNKPAVVYLYDLSGRLLQRAEWPQGMDYLQLPAPESSGMILYRVVGQRGELLRAGKLVVR